jgi:anti-sigma factor RsiW
MNCEEVRELLPAYVLGALDAEELEALEAHLRDGREHDDELVELRATVFALDSLGDEAPVDAAPAPVLLRPEPSSRASQPGVFSLWQLGAAAVLLLAAFGAGWLVSELVRTDPSEEVSIFLQGPDGQSVDMQGSDAAESVTVTMAGFVRLTDGRAYQLWAIRDGEWLRIGVCNMNEQGGWVGDFGFTIRSGEQVALTIEPGGGSTSPSSPPILSSASLAQ